MADTLRGFVRETLIETIIEESRVEFAGDELALIEDEGCVDPLGHLFKTSCGGTACIHCGMVAWS